MRQSLTGRVDAVSTQLRRHEQLSQSLQVILVWARQLRVRQALSRWGITALDGRNGVSQVNRLHDALVAQRVPLEKALAEQTEEQTKPDKPGNPYELDDYLVFVDPDSEEKYARDHQAVRRGVFTVIAASFAVAAGSALAAGGETLSAGPVVVVALLGVVIGLLDIDLILSPFGGDASWFYSKKPSSHSVAPEEHIKGPAAMSKQAWQTGEEGNKSSEIQATAPASMAVPTGSEQLGWRQLYASAVERFRHTSEVSPTVHYSVPVLLCCLGIYAAAMEADDQNPAYWAGILVLSVLPMMIDVSVYVSFGVALSAIAVTGVAWHGLTYVAAALYFFAALWWLNAAFLRITEKRQMWGERHEVLERLEELEGRQHIIAAELRSHLPASRNNRESGFLFDPKANGVAQERGPVLVVVVECAGLPSDVFRGPKVRQACERLHHLFVHLDGAVKAAQRRGLSVTKIGTTGTRYMAVCGLEGGLRIDAMAPGSKLLCLDMLQRTDGCCKIGVCAGIAVLTMGEVYLPMIHVDGFPVDEAKELAKTATANHMNVTRSMAVYMGLATRIDNSSMMRDAIEDDDRFRSEAQETYQFSPLEGQGPPMPPLHELLADLRQGARAGHESEGGERSETHRKACWRETEAQAQREAGTRPGCEQGLGPLDFLSGLWLSEIHQYVFFTYLRRRSGSTTSMVAGAGLNVLLCLVRMAEYFFHTALRDMDVIVISSHLVLAVLMLCAAVTGQTLLFFRRTSAYPAYLGTNQTSFFFAMGMYALICLAMDPKGVDVEACFVVVAVLHAHGTAITSVDRDAMLVTQAGMACGCLALIDDGGFRHVLRILGALVCALASCSLEHNSLCRAFLSEHALTEDIDALEKEVRQAEELVGHLYPIALHRHLEKAAEKKESLLSTAGEINSLSIMCAEFMVITDGVMKAPPMEAMKALHALYSRCDELAHEVEAEKLRTDYNKYYAMAGAPVPYLGSHATAMAVLGLKVVTLARQHNEGNKRYQFVVRVGVGSGSAVGAVMGGVGQLRFGVWGDAIDAAKAMLSRSQLDGVRVGDETYAILNMAHLRDNYHFKEVGRPAGSNSKTSSFGRGRILVALKPGEEAPTKANRSVKSSRRGADSLLGETVFSTQMTSTQMSTQLTQCSQMEETATQMSIVSTGSDGPSPHTSPVPIPDADPREWSGISEPPVSNRGRSQLPEEEALKSSEAAPPQVETASTDTPSKEDKVRPADAAAAATTQQPPTAEL